MLCPFLFVMSCWRQSQSRGDVEWIADQVPNDTVEVILTKIRIKRSAWSFFRVYFGTIVAGNGYFYHLFTNY